MTPSAVLFAAVCLAGTTAAVVLTVHEARYVPPVDVRVVSSERVGGETVVTARARNTTEADRCVRIGVAARDREGLDLARADGPEQVIEAGATTTLTMRLPVSEQDYEERQQRTDAYVLPC